MKEWYDNPNALTKALDNKIKEHVLADKQRALEKIAALDNDLKKASTGSLASMYGMQGIAPTKGTKYDSGKPPVSLVPQAMLYGAARAYEFGARKYARHNYRLGINASRLLDAAMRHLSEVAEGKTVDEESGLHPLDHAAAALGMLMDTLERVRKGKLSENFNDLYKEVPS